LENEKKCTHTVLNSGEYINDLFNGETKYFVNLKGQLIGEGR
jgi:hypothetical protein